MPRVILALLLLGSPVCAGEPIRLILHGGMTAEPPDEEYLRFVEQVRPDAVVMGVFDQRLYSLAFPSDRKKPPTPAELLARWKQVADRLHKGGIKLIGQMEINVVTDRPLDREQSLGWFGYFDKGWDETRLGTRPTKSATEMLEEPDADPRAKPGDLTALCGCRINTKALMGCINKPAWRETQKRMVRAAVELGVDGFLTNRNYFGHCACEHCRAGFRKWLTERYSAEERKRLFNIANIDTHPLTCVVGMHREIGSTPDALVMEKQRYMKHRVKDFFDDVYILNGRKLKEGLVLGQWNHLAFFDELHLDRGHLPVSTRTTFAHAAADERWGLPPELWAKDEDLAWYCNWGTTQNTILEKQYAGDAVLYGKYVHAMARGKTVVINKYDFYRPRNMMAEAAAMGCATNAIATPYQTAEDREVMLRYFRFLKKHAELYRPAESFAEVALVFPRRAIHAGDASPLEYAEAAGRAMIRGHVLFDLLPDDLPISLDRYRVVMLSGADYLEKSEVEALARYAKAGGKLIVLPVRREDRERPGAASPASRFMRHAVKLDATVIENGRLEPAAIMKELPELSKFMAPWTVEVHAYRQPTAKRIVLHLVNYNHREKATGKSVVERESPIAAEPVAVRLHLPKGFRVRKVEFLSPDEAKMQSVEFRQDGAVLECKTPGFLVYGVCAISQ